MTTDRAVVCVMLVLVLSCPAVHAGDAQSAFPRYTVQEITGLPLAGCYAIAINNKGDVLLQWSASGSKEHHAYLWSGGNVTEIGTLGGTQEPIVLRDCEARLVGTRAFALNDQCQVVGVSQAPDGNNHAFLWENGKMLDLGTLGGKLSRASDINNLGQVVGRSYAGDDKEHAFIWDRENGMRDLGAPTPSCASKINDKGQVMGRCSYRYVPFVWEDGKISYPEPKPLKGFGRFQGLGMNSRGDVIGSVDNIGQADRGCYERRALLYSRDRFIPVEVAGLTMASAVAVTSDGLVVGNVYNASYRQQGFIWRDGNSALLNDLITETGWDISTTRAVNEPGQIAAQAERDGKRMPALLSPVAARHSRREQGL